MGGGRASSYAISENGGDTYAACAGVPVPAPRSHRVRLARNEDAHRICARTFGGAYPEEARNTITFQDIPRRYESEQGQTADYTVHQTRHGAVASEKWWP